MSEDDSRESSDDEVFFELDLFINPQANCSGLHLFQYPLRPADRPYTDGGNTLLGVSIHQPKEKQMDHAMLMADHKMD